MSIRMVDMTFGSPLQKFKNGHVLSSRFLIPETRPSDSALLKRLDQKFHNKFFTYFTKDTELTRFFDLADSVLCHRDCMWTFFRWGDLIRWVYVGLLRIWTLQSETLDIQCYLFDEVPKTQHIKIFDGAVSEARPACPFFVIKSWPMARAFFWAVTTVKS